MTPHSTKYSNTARPCGAQTKYFKYFNFEPTSCFTTTISVYIVISSSKVKLQKTHKPWTWTIRVPSKHLGWQEVFQSRVSFSHLDLLHFEGLIYINCKSTSSLVPQPYNIENRISKVLPFRFNSARTVWLKSLNMIRWQFLLVSLHLVIILPTLNWAFSHNSIFHQSWWINYQNVENCAINFIT